MIARTMVALSVLAGAASAAPLLGTQRIAALIVRVGDDTALISDADLRARWQARLDNFATFMSASSWGRVQFEFVVKGPYLVSETLCTTYQQDPTYSMNQEMAMREGIRAADPEVDFSLVDGLMTLTRTPGYPSCPMNGSGRSNYAVTADGTFLLPLVWWNDINIDSDATGMLHEYGHAVGQAHLDPLLCTVKGQRVAIEHSPPMTHWQRCELAPTYVDMDPLGSYGTLVNRDWIMARKIFWEWTSDAEVVTANSTSVVTLSQMGNRAGVKAVVVPTTGSSMYEKYVVEYRGMGDVEPGVAVPGVYLYAVRQDGIVEPVEAPPFVSETEYTQKPLELGVPYVDKKMGITITVTAMLKGATIRIDRPNTCTHCL